MKTNASEQDIFRATTGLALHASLARTLAYCLFWSQHATHWDGDLPTIWKTGPQLQSELRIAARTANRHFKELAEAGYWTISYRPRPGSIGKVTWLTLTARALELVTTARGHAAIGAAKKKKRDMPSCCHSHSQSGGMDCDIPLAQNVTSKKLYQTGKTSEKMKGFILPSKAGKTGTHEASSSIVTGEDDEYAPKAPGYLKTSPLDKEFATVVQTTWSKAGLKEWEWSSRFTWKHIAEIRRKLTDFDVVEGQQIAAFLGALIENWGWLRTCMAPRYAHHDLNLHAPSAMALAHEIDVLGKHVIEKMLPQAIKPKQSKLDDDL